jgi:hypothetical protein
LFADLMRAKRELAMTLRSLLMCIDLCCARLNNGMAAVAIVRARILLTAVGQIEQGRLACPAPGS